jgi:predicted LPLAT superfamily acyltransferase
VRFYRTLYPDRNRLFHLWCAWRQFHDFADVFMDRFLLQESDELKFTSEGCEHLEQSIDAGKGGILLMSHMGNWDVAAHLLKRKVNRVRLLLYMGVKQKEQLEQIQKESLSRSGIQIIAVEQDGGSPMDILEGIKFIESGGVVSLTGDLLWNKDQRTVPVKFLGREILLPEAPHLFALLSGTPLFIFFPFGRGKINIISRCRAPLSWLAPLERKEPRPFGALLNNTPISWKRPFATILCSGTILNLFSLLNPVRINRD